MLPQIGKGREARVADSIAGMEQIRKDLEESRPEVAVIVSPHGTVQPDAMGVVTAPRSRGSMAQWGAEGLEYGFDNDPELVDLLIEEADVPITPIGEEGYVLDHGVMVPAFFLSSVLSRIPLVVISFSMLSLETHLAFGRGICRAAARRGKRVAFIASGDLSHRLLPEAPAGFDPMGRVFDSDVKEAVESLDGQALVETDPELITRAGECGLQSVIILMGALEGLGATPRVLAYEGPFGVGYLTASFQTAEHVLLKLARDAVEDYVRSNVVKEPPPVLPKELRKSAGAFVTIMHRGELRGCIGTTYPRKETVAMEVIANAIKSATKDTRFPPVAIEELDELEYSVDVLTTPEPVDGPSQLDPKTYGLLVQNGGKIGVLLPGIEQVQTAEQQISICKSKAGLSSDDEVALFRFRVQRFGAKV